MAVQTAYIWKKVVKHAGFGVVLLLVAGILAEMGREGVAAQTMNPCHAHSGNSAMAGEHCAALALVDVANVTHTVISSGNWSDASVWQNGTLPTDGAHIHIPHNITLTVDGVIAHSFKTVRIDGTLRFKPSVNSELRVDTIVGAPGSRFEIGTADNPIAADVTARVLFADDGPIDQNWDPKQLSRGAILHGTVVMHGAEKTSWTTLAQHPRAGDREIQLSKAPTGWRVGDTLVIAGTQSITSDEKVQITAISGKKITIQPRLQHDHVAPRADLDVHVANTTRNIHFESENPAIAHRGHLMFMHTRDVDIRYTGFYRLGRTDKSRTLDDILGFQDDTLVPIPGPRTNIRARYSVHFHRNGVKKDSPPAVVRGSVVFDNPGWGYVNHSSYVEFVDNVAYDVTGSAYNTETGDEVGSFINNISIRSINPRLDDPNENRDEREDFGWEGDGFWFHSAGVTIENNVATGASGNGFILWTKGMREPDLQRKAKALAENLADPTIANGQTEVPVEFVPTVSFKGNTAYRSAGGLEIVYLGTKFLHTSIGSDDGLSHPITVNHAKINNLIEDMTVWNANSPVRLSYTENLTFRNLKLFGQPGGEEASIALRLGNNYQNGRFHFDNPRVEGFDIGIVVPQNGYVTVDGGTYANATDFVIPAARQNHHKVEFTGNINFESNGLNNGNRVHFDMNYGFGEDNGLADDVACEFFLLHNVISLNFGPYQNQRLYFNEQAADIVLSEQQFATGKIRMAKKYVGLSNQEILDQFGKTTGGAIMPADAVTADRITGGKLASPGTGAVNIPDQLPPFDPGDEDSQPCEDGEESSGDGGEDSSGDDGEDSSGDSSGDDGEESSGDDGEESSDNEECEAEDDEDEASECEEEEDDEDEEEEEDETSECEEEECEEEDEQEPEECEVEGEEEEEEDEEDDEDEDASECEEEHESDEDDEE